MAILKSTNLFNFRNFKNLDLSFDEKLNIFFGQNGTGKTNILEAISLIAKGRGIRNASINDLIKKNEKNFLIKNNLEIKNNHFNIEIRFKKYHLPIFTSSYVLLFPPRSSHSTDLSVSLLATSVFFRVIFSREPMPF